MLSFSGFDRPQYPRHHWSQFMWLISHAEHDKEIVTPGAPISLIEIVRSDYGNDASEAYTHLECISYRAHRSVSMDQCRPDSGG